MFASVDADGDGKIEFVQDFGRTSAAPRPHLGRTSAAIGHTSAAPRPHPGRTSAAPRPHLGRTSAAIGRTSAAIGRTSAAPRPHLSHTSTMHLFVGVQGHFGRGAARTNKHARTRARTRVCVKDFLAHLILPRRGLAARRAAASSAGCLGGRCTWGRRGWSSVRRRLSSRSQRQSHGREAS